MVDFEAIMEKTKEVRRKKDALNRAREKATDTSPKLTGMPSGGGNGKRLENDVVNLVDIQAAHDKAEGELKALREELRPHLRRLKKWQHKDVIKKRYLEGKTISVVMEEIGYEWSQTNRFLTEARDIINKTNME